MSKGASSQENILDSAVARSYFDNSKVALLHLPNKALGGWAKRPYIF
jgi:hypothetical protein